MISALRLFLLPKSEDTSSGRGRPRPESVTPVGSTPARPVSTPGTYGRVRIDDEARVLARMRTGDSAAYETIFVAYYSALAGYAATLLGDDAAAEDVAQIVLIRLWTARETVTPTSLGAYLFTAVRNTVRDQQRHGTRAQARADRWSHEELTSAVVPTPLQNAEDEEGWPPSLDAVERVVATLPPRCQEVFRLKWEQGLRYAEIAALLGISVRTVDAQLVKAATALRAAFRRPPV